VNRYFLKPGYILMTAEPTVVMAVLGSAVAVTIFDPIMQMGGMNHFVHPALKTGDSPTALYAKPATVKLIKMFSEVGAHIGGLEAHIFGGGCPAGASEEQREVGLHNVTEAETLLKECGINIVGKETGGQYGRKIMFNTYTGEVIIAKVEKIRQDDWFPGEIPPRDEVE
jgi:chemotaxis protein CheD